MEMWQALSGMRRGCVELAIRMCLSGTLFISSRSRVSGTSGYYSDDSESRIDILQSSMADAAAAGGASRNLTVFDKS
jgi:hypothetical protein